MGWRGLVVVRIGCQNEGGALKILALTDKPDLPERALLAALSSCGHELLVLCGAPPTSLLFPKEGLSRVEQLSVRSRFDLRAIRTVRAAIIDFKPDIIHAFTGRTLTIANLATVGLRVRIVTYRGTSGHLSRFDPMSWLSFLSPKVQAISCVSDAVRRYLLQQGVPEQKLRVIYKGHNPAWYQAAPRSVWQEMGIPPDRVIAICVANARPVKGVDILLRALEQLPPDSRLHAVIVGELRDERLTALAQRVSQRVRLLGYRSDAAALAGAADLLVVPSRAREGLPKSMMEAMAQGVPVVVTRVGGMPEIVRDGVEGLVVPPESADDLSAALLQMQTDVAFRVASGQAARKRITQEFGVEQLVQQTRDLYESVLRSV